MLYGRVPACISHERERQERRSIGTLDSIDPGCVTQAQMPLTLEAYHDVSNGCLLLSSQPLSHP